MRDQRQKRPNAQRHGAYVSTLIAPGEDPQEFQELYSDLAEEWMPDGPTEEDAVLSIAKAMWRKRRVQKFLEGQLSDFQRSREGSILAAVAHPSEIFWNDLFRNELSLDERLDAMIDRAVKRLIQMKAVKQMLPQTNPDPADDNSVVKKLRAGGS
jgi:hypothetical protein